MIAQKDRVCLYCLSIPKCPLLEDEKGHFDPSKPITPNALRECTSWVPVRWLTREVRDRLYAKGGSGILRGLYLLPELVSTKLERQEETYEMSDVIDFACMIKPGMTANERRDQLQYVTNDSGDVDLDKNGRPTPRNSHEYRFFAISKDFHVGLDIDTGLFWRADEVLDYIIDREIELGLIAGKDRNKPQSKAATARETKMGKAVLRRGSKSGAKDAKDTKETKKVGRPRRSPKNANKNADSGNGGSSEAGHTHTLDFSHIEEQIASLKEEVAALSEKVGSGGGGCGGEGGGEVIDIITNLHGVMTDFIEGVKTLADDASGVLEEIANEFELPVPEEDSGDED